MTYNDLGQRLVTDKEIIDGPMNGLGSRSEAIGLSHGVKRMDRFQEIQRANNQCHAGRRCPFKVDANDGHGDGRRYMAELLIDTEVKLGEMIADRTDGSPIRTIGGTFKGRERDLPPNITKKESHLVQTERAKPGPEKKDRSYDVTEPPTLTDLGLTKREASEAQMLASIPQNTKRGSDQRHAGRRCPLKVDGQNGMVTVDKNGVGAEKIGEAPIPPPDSNFVVSITSLRFINQFLPFPRGECVSYDFRREVIPVSKDEILKSVGSGEAYVRLIREEYANKEEKDALQYLTGMSAEEIAEAKNRMMTPKD